MEFLSEREAIIGKLERGMYLTKFFAKKKPEKKMFCIRRETLSLVWSRVIASSSLSLNLGAAGSSSSSSSSGLIPNAGSHQGLGSASNAGALSGQGRILWAQPRKDFSQAIFSPSLQAILVPATPSRASWTSGPSRRSDPGPRNLGILPNGPMTYRQAGPRGKGAS